MSQTNYFPYLSQLDESSKRRCIKLNEVMDIDKDKNYIDRRVPTCYHCEYTSSHGGTLKRHLKTHGGEKSNKCNQCDFASSYASALGTHLKTHSGEKSNKCNQCDFASLQAGDLRRHLKTHVAFKASPKYGENFP